ncbi:MAG: PIN domain-containing protein, partial [Gammaproteobacteria bacterium]
GAVITAAKQHRESLKNPPKSAGDYIDTLAAQGLAISANRFREFIELI